MTAFQSLKCAKKAVEEINFPIKKPDYYLRQVIKVVVHSDKSC